MLPLGLVLLALAALGPALLGPTLEHVAEPAAFPTEKGGATRRRQTHHCPDGLCLIEVCLHISAIPVSRPLLPNRSLPVLLVHVLVAALPALLSQMRVSRALVLNLCTSHPHMHTDCRHTSVMGKLCIRTIPTRANTTIKGYQLELCTFECSDVLLNVECNFVLLNVRTYPWRAWRPWPPSPPSPATPPHHDTFSLPPSYAISKRVES